MNNTPATPTFIDVLIVCGPDARILDRQHPAHSPVELGDFVLYPTRNGDVAIDCGSYEAVAPTLDDALEYLEGDDARAQQCASNAPNTRGVWSGISLVLAAVVAGLFSFVR